MVSHVADICIVHLIIIQRYNWFVIKVSRGVGEM